MALTDTHVLGAEVEAAPVAPVAEAAVAAVEVVADNAVKEDFDPSILGSLSDKWQFMASVADDTKPDTNKIKDAKTGEVREITTGKFIGYIFKALEDGLAYPQMKIDYDFFNKPFKVQDVEWKTAKKGEKVILTTAETLGLMSTPEINGFINGGGIAVQTAYSKPSKATGADADAVLPIKGHLNPAQGTESLKVLPIKVAITGTKVEGTGTIDEKTGKLLFQKTNRKVEKGFERFLPALEAKPRKVATAAAGAAVAQTYTTQRNKNAAAFAAAFNARRA